jgi:hypothetical protein
LLKKNQTTDHSCKFYLIIVAILGSVLLFSLLIEPSRFKFIDVCLFHILTGLPCMTCGMTRAFHSISLGNLREAIDYHPLSILLYILVVAHFIIAVFGIFGLKLNIYRIHRVFPYIVLGIFFIFWTLRLFAGIFYL